MAAIQRIARPSFFRPLPTVPMLLPSCSVWPSENGVVRWLGSAPGPLKAVRLSRSAEAMLSKHRAGKAAAAAAARRGTPEAKVQRAAASSARTASLRACTSLTALLAKYEEGKQYMDHLNRAAALRCMARILKRSSKTARKAALTSPAAQALVREVRSHMRLAGNPDSPAWLPPHIACMFLHSLMGLRQATVEDVLTGTQLLLEGAQKGAAGDPTSGPVLRVPNLTQTAGLYTAMASWLPRASVSDAGVVRERLTELLPLSLAATRSSGRQAQDASHAAGMLWACTKAGIGRSQDVWGVAALVLAHPHALTPGAAVMAITSTVALREGEADVPVASLQGDTVPQWAQPAAASGDTPLSTHIAACLAHLPALHASVWSASEASGTLWALLRHRVPADTPLPVPPGQPPLQYGDALVELADKLLLSLGGQAPLPSLPGPGLPPRTPTWEEQMAIQAAWGVASVLHRSADDQGALGAWRDAAGGKVVSALDALQPLATTMASGGFLVPPTRQADALRRLRTRSKQVLKLHQLLSRRYSAPVVPGPVCDDPFAEAVAAMDREG